MTEEKFWEFLKKAWEKGRVPQVSGEFKRVKRVRSLLLTIGY